MLSFALRIMQLVPMGFMGAYMASDCLHGKLKREFVDKLGYPPWFPTCLGFWKLSISALNWGFNGQFVWLAQALTAFHMGGAIYTHSVAEGKPAGCAPPAFFLAGTTYVQSSLGHFSLISCVSIHAALAAAGFVSGFGITALGRGSVYDGSMSPVRHHKMRGFGAEGAPWKNLKHLD
jgi:hypothetical protein